MVFRLIHTASKSIGDFLFPKRCLGCRAPNTLFCRKCELFYAMPERTRLSSGVITLSLFRYSTPPIRQVVRHIKYRHAYTLAEQFGDICKKYAHDLAPLFPPDASVMVIPIPISSKTKRTRGYNHTEIFARAIADAHRWDMRLDALKKIKHTPSQTTFHTKQERKNNIKNSIALSDAFSPKGKTILLVDDVLTTGATLNECARLLQNAGAKKIFGIVVAKG